MTTATAEALDDSSSNTAFREMGFSIEKVTVTAKSPCAESRVQHRTRTRPEGDSWSGC